MKGIFASVAIALVATTGSARASEDATDWIRNTLSNSRSAAGSCTSESAAIDGTMTRIRNIRLPEAGKVIVVNIPSGVITAYEDGVPVIESKAVVGKAATPTPELDTHVTYVRPNPTWTVPRSIIKRNKWLDKLASQPEFFEDNNFRIISGGIEVSPYDAAENPEAVDSFVQKPGPGNALGSIKIGIENSQAIYLHDTNDPGKFDSEVRAASAGCVRIERVGEIAAWIMDISPDEMQGLVDEGSTQNLTPPETVKVILGYWTAWPDAGGTTRFYPDIYGKDGTCGRNMEASGDPDEVNEPQAEEREAPGPRFIPSGEAQDAYSQLTPVWTETEAR
ncbi:L,D-transpeptidase family protein [Sinorhizobium meliloti]|nr:L,D-transpeptidase family protein [Sinorhizobium meliloti]